MPVARKRSELLTVADVVRQKGIPRSTVYWLIKEGYLPAYKEEGRSGRKGLYLLPEDVERIEELKRTKVIALQPVRRRAEETEQR